MITKLTPEQKKLKEIVKSEWISNLTAKADKKKIKEVCEYVYFLANLKKPKVIILNSPLAIQYAANLLNKKEVGREVEQEEVRQEVWQEVRQEVWQEVGREVEQEVELEVGQEVRQEVGQEVRREVWREVWQEVWREVGQEVGQEVEQEVEQEVWQEVWREVWQEVWQEKLKYYSFGSYLSSWYYDWYSFYDYFHRIKAIKNEKFLKLKEGVKGIFEVIYLKGYCLVSTCPEYVKKKAGRLHNEHGPAVKFRDGYSVYALNGVRFPKKLYLQVISRKMKMEDILKIKDIDQRTQAMKFASSRIRDFYLSQKGKMTDEVFKLDVKGRPVKYQLWKIPQGEVFNREVAFVLYDCPSSIERGEKQEYASGVPVEFNSVAEAMAWKMSDNELPMTVEEWIGLTPLKDES